MRKSRRAKRELKYFYLENKFIVNVIGGIILGIVALILFLNVFFFNKKNNEGVSIKTSTFSYRVNKTYETNLNYKGEIIEPGYSFVIVNFDVKNIIKQPISLNLNDFSLCYKNSCVSPIVNRYKSLLEFGTGYNGDLINYGLTKNYVMVFKLNDNMIDKKLILNYYDKNSNSSRLESKYRRIKLDPYQFGKVSEVKKVDLNQEIIFSESLLKNSKLLIEKFELNDEYNIDYKSCIKDDCKDLLENISITNMTTDKRTIMKLNTNFVIDESLSISEIKNIYNIFEYFGRIRYQVNNETKESSFLQNRTPNLYSGGMILAEVPAELKDANIIDIVLTFRDKQYVYHLR